MNLYSINLAGLLIVCAALFVAQRKGPASKNVKKDDGIKQSEEPSSQWHFLVVYALVMGADWLQGPFLYPLYHDEHHLPHSLISTLFTTGFLAGAVSGAFIGALADRHGRKKACLLFCVSYALSCLLTVFPPTFRSILFLFLGRALGGLSTSLLFSVFESWMVADFNARGLEKKNKKGGSLSEMFGTMSTINSLVAIGSGVVSEWLVAVSGTKKAPFLASVGVLAVAFGVIWGSWDEHYGNTSSTETPSKEETAPVTSDSNPPDNNTLVSSSQTSSTLSKILTNPQILALGLASTMFEGSMYLFVFFWTPALRSTTSKSNSAALPYGVIFASFMASCLVASLSFNALMSTTSNSEKRRPVITHSRLLVAILATSAICFFLSAHPASEQSAFWVFCLFEAAVGGYWPTMGTLKSRVIDDGIRSQVYGLLRVPLNVFVVVSLLVTGVGGEASFASVFTTCGMILSGTSGVLAVVGL